MAAASVAFRGSDEQLRLCKRDLPTLQAAEKLTRQRRVAVQAGGNLGVFPKHLAQSFDAVYTFEPSQELFPILIANATERNILRYQAALGYHREMVGTSRIRRDGKPNNHEGITHISGPGPIPTLRLDDFTFPVCDLLQLDLEGWELYALQGAVETIARCRPVLMVEVNKNAAFVGIKEDDIRWYVLSLGYQFVTRIHSDEIYVPIERGES